MFFFFFTGILDGPGKVFSTKFISGTLVDPSGIIKILDPAFLGGSQVDDAKVYIMEF